MVDNTIRPAGWSGELQNLQDETMRLLRTIRDGSAPLQCQQQQREQRLGRHANRRRRKIRSDGGAGATIGERSAERGRRSGNGTPRRRRRRKRVGRKAPDVSQGHSPPASTEYENRGLRSFSYTLDTSGWPVGGEPSGVPTSEMGIGKTTVEILDKGEDTPRSPLDSGLPPDDGLPSPAFKKGSKEEALTLGTEEEEGRFRSLSFKDEEGRVRDGCDTYVPGHTRGLGEELQRLKAERNRLAVIEEGQRQVCRGEKRQAFLRFARRKWLASDLAAETVQRVFRGHIGRKRAALSAEVRRLTGHARTEWVEVRDHNRGEAWYFNPLTQKSQWERPVSLLGTITPSDKVRTLPILGPSSPSKKRPLPKSFDPGTPVERAGVVGSTHAGGADEGRQAPPEHQLRRGVAGTSTWSRTPTNPVANGGARPAGGPSIGGGIAAATCSTLPPLMKGSRLSVLSTTPAVAGSRGVNDGGGNNGDFAPPCSPGGEFGITEGERGERGGMRWRDKQQAWVERDRVQGEDGVGAFPFLVEDEMVLPDDGFEETGLGAAGRGGEEGTCEGSEEESRDDDSDADGAGGSSSFFLADGTPNIRLRRTIANALRVTKFDSVSTLLADYTGRQIAAANGNDDGDATAPALANMPSHPKPRRRAATAAPTSGGGAGASGTRFRSSKKRSRLNSDAVTDNAGDNPVTGKVARSSTATGVGCKDRETIPRWYPSGKLEEDKNPPLFAASAGGGRKMVSLMTTAGGAAGRKSAGGGARHGVSRRRARTAGVALRGQREGEKGSVLKGLAIRDLTPPGFGLTPAEARATAGAEAGDNGLLGAGGAATGATSAERGGGDTEGGSSGAVQVYATPGETEGAKAGAAAAAGGEAAHGSGGSAYPQQAKKDVPEVPKAKEICFNCWSKGSGKTCALHASQAGKMEVGKGQGGGGGGGGSAGKADGEARVAESALMCKNWDVGVMRRRYRSEELQEVFAKEASSLRYDKERKKFISTVEQRHPIYRLLARIIARYNFTVRRRLHQKNWMRGFVEQLRLGKVVGISADEARRTAKLLKLRNTLQNLAQVSAFTATAKATQPKAPITGTTMAERRGLVKVVIDRPSAVMGRVTRVVLDGPTPVPQVLYEARRYPLPPAKTMPMPEPRYLVDVGEGNESEANGGTVDGQDARVDEGGEGSASATNGLAAWMPLLSKATAEGIVLSAVTNVEVMSPVPGSDEVGRTKHPPALTIKFATFSRKPTPAMMAVGGLPAEMVVHMLVTTRMAPQYGNFTVMQKSSVAPTVSEERSAEYESLELLVENQAFLPRALQHPLNSRKAPTVTVKTLMADPGNRHYFGLNRPEQTGEADSHGFRTSAHADAAPALPTLDPTAFTPSEEVVTPNLCSANRTVTTHADRSYPFCEPSNRSNTTLDFYHLLLTATCSPNKEQVFTNLGAQECGEFMRGSDPMRPMGHCIGIVYRSWAFLQRQILEEFETDDGVSYWFDRRTGETFWERPLCPEEKVPIKEGGTILGGQGEPPDSSSGAFESIKPRYDQQQMRKLMMKSYEGTEALERRRKQVSTGVKWARENGALPPPDPSDLRPPTPDVDDADVLEPEGAERTSSPGHETSSTPLNPASTGPPRSGTGDQHQQRNGDSSPRRSPTSGRAGGSRTDGRGQKTGRSGGVCSENKADRLAASISQALKDAGLNEGRNVKPSDMLRFGMGLGITLGANGLLGDLEGGGGAGADGAGGGNNGVQGRGGDRQRFEATGEVEASLAPPVVKISPNGHPIGHGHTEPIAEKEDSVILDHKGEAEHLASIVRDSAGLKTSEEFKGLLVVPPEPTPCPDDDYGVTRPEDVEADPRRKAELSIPVVAYPETLWKKQYRGHGAAGEGQSWQPAGGDRAANQRAKSSLGVTMRRTNETLPEGFLNAISHTHVGKQHCDYLPHVPNMPQARAIGRVKPRSAAEDWFAVGFDPWSAGREPLSAEFIPSLSIKQEDLGGDGDGGGASIVPQTGYLELKDSAGHAEMAVVSAEEAKLASDFEQITSWARHARYADVETAMNQADWTMPIDYQNDLGLTLLHVAAQNGNKRIAKLCLRKGADVNKRNNNGQTALHYAYSYGFESFGEYLISKGADDSIVNADGLTCYEGLNQDNLGQL